MSPLPPFVYRNIIVVLDIITLTSRLDGCLVQKLVDFVYARPFMPDVINN